MKELSISLFWTYFVSVQTEENVHIFNNLKQADLQFRHNYRFKTDIFSDHSLHSKVLNFEHVVIKLSNIKLQNSWNLGIEARNKKLQNTNQKFTSPQRYRKTRLTVVFLSYIEGFVKEMRNFMTNRVATLSEIHCFSYDTVYILFMTEHYSEDLFFDLYRVMGQCNMLSIVVKYYCQIESPLEYSLQYTHSAIFC